MSIKTIATVLSDPENAAAVIDTAMALAVGHDAHLIGLHAEVVEPPPVMSPFDLPDSSVIAALYEAAAERRKTIEAAFNAAATGRGVEHTWRAMRGTGVMASQGVIEACRSSDLVVAGQPGKGRVSDVDDILFEGGRPVLFVPWIERAARPFERVLVAWDSSRESTRAIFDALPLLTSASAIEVFSIDPPDASTRADGLTGAEIADTLARHGLAVEINAQNSERISVSAVLENRCSDFAADLLVMGAYSHARIRERLFGGVTQMLLESMTVPVLMSR